mmetsp:Transcript_115175/g.229409  ORF Transcript_115175/g.229409 Transcript_115175/m.229409 type:complete len:239 (-) Transcript_115175:106-822(-)
MASQPVVPKLNLPSANLPTARSDWGDSRFSSRSYSREMPGVPQTSEYKNPWPGLEDRFWQPPADATERGLGGFMSARVGAAWSQRLSEVPSEVSESSRSWCKPNPPSARPPMHGQRYGEPNSHSSKQYTSNTEPNSWWLSSSTFSPNLSCNVSAPAPKERNCNGAKEGSRHCTVDRQCNHLTQDCEDNIKELLFRDADEEVEERPLRPQVDAFAECRPHTDRPDTLKGTLQSWSLPGR